MLQLPWTCALPSAAAGTLLQLLAWGRARRSPLAQLLPCNGAGSPTPPATTRALQGAADSCWQARGCLPWQLAFRSAQWGLGHDDSVTGHDDSVTGSPRRYS